MKKRTLFLFILHLMVFPLSCAYERNNLLDEGGSNYIPPEIIIDEETSSVKDFDTIHIDSITVVLTGNHELSLFSLKLDSGEWKVEWQPEDTFTFYDITDGSHTLYINSMYSGGKLVVTDLIKFHVLTKGFKPEFKIKTDTTIRSFEEKKVSIITDAHGASPMKFVWLKNGKQLESEESDTLEIISFSANDTASYKCVVSNEYGKDTSRTFILKSRPFTGGIKGLIADSTGNKLKNSLITLLPADKQTQTGDNGTFEFTGLPGNSYTIEITLKGYHDTILSEIIVNDSEMVDIDTIKLTLIDTTEFQVTYDGNGNDKGKVPVDTTGYKPASNVVVSADTGNFSKKGYAFYSWNTEKDGSGVGFAPGDTYVINDNLTFYAQWVIKQYNLKFDDNGSTSGEIPEKKKYKYKSIVTIPGSGNLEREGYRFLSWNTKQDGSGISYTEGDTFSMPDSDMELFAQWKALPVYKVTYNANDADSGKVPVDNDSYYEGKEVTVAGNPGNLYKDGYSYSGWNTKANGEGETFNAGAKFAMPDSAVTLYVKWTTNPTYSIVYHGNTNTGGEVPQTVDADSGTEVTIADSGSLYKTGYDFVEWNTKEDGSGKSCKTGDKIIMDTVDIDLYAQWTKARYSVIYNGNGNTGGTVPPKTTHLYQSEITVTDSGSISKTGYSFYCWHTDSAGNGIDYNGGDKITIENDIHLFARWIKKKYRITFSGNGDRVQNVPDITEYEYGSKIDSVAVVPSRQSYTFDGWFRDSLCTDKWKYDSDSVISHDTLYARWIIKDIDGNIYTEVKIGDQVWMVENLKVTRYNDGTIIPKITTSAAWTNLYSCEQNPCIYKSGYCWYNNDSTTYHIYGTLYSWAVVGTNKLAPTGWHVPSQLEFEKLVQLIKNDESVNVVGGKLKETGTSHWDEPNEGATDSVGFKALPGGFRNHDGEGTFGGIGKIGCWWLSTDVTMGASMCFRITYDRINLENNYSSKSAGYNVRCIRDW